MENKTSLIIVVVVAIFLIFGFIGYSYFSNQNNHVTISNVVFTVPEGYNQIDYLSENEVNMSNGYNSMILLKCNTTGIQKNIHDYQKYKNNHNYSSEISNFTVNNITVFKVVILNNTDITHYWFDYNNKTFSVYSWDATNKNSDDFVSKLINSIESK